MAGVAVRGEIWMMELGFTAKVRPCLILSIEFRDDERALVTYVPRTTSLRGGRFEVAHQATRFKPGAFDAQNLNTVPTAFLANAVMYRLHLRQSRALWTRFAGRSSAW